MHLAWVGYLVEDVQHTGNEWDAADVTPNVIVRSPVRGISRHQLISARFYRSVAKKMHVCLWGFPHHQPRDLAEPSFRRGQLPLDMSPRLRSSDFGKQTHACTVTMFAHLVAQDAALPPLISTIPPANHQLDARRSTEPLARTSCHQQERPTGAAIGFASCSDEQYERAGSSYVMRCYPRTEHHPCARMLPPHDNKPARRFWGANSSAA